MTSLPQPSPHAAHWVLDPNVVFLNHGSYGACPRVVLERQQALRLQLEREPLRFFIREWEPLLDAARAALAQFVDAPADSLVFVPNATSAVNAVLRSLSLHAGAEVLVTSQEYNACRNALDVVCAASGARPVVVQIPFPIISKEQVVEAVAQRINPRTKLLLIDHVVSITGTINPVSDILALAAERGVEVLVDGAHAPAMLPLSIRALRPTYYTGNCHKWLCSPKGAAFLYVDAARREQIRPVITSHGYNSPRTDRSRYQLEGDWLGTHDPTPYLSVPEAIQFLASLLPGGFDELRARNNRLAREGAALIENALNLKRTAPDDMLASMVTFLLPPALTKFGAPNLHDRLFDEFAIEAQVVPGIDPADLALRISAHAYNALAQYEYLAETLKALL